MHEYFVMKCRDGDSHVCEQAGPRCRRDRLMWRALGQWVRVSGETPPSQAARLDEPSAAVQAAHGSDKRFDESQSGQVPLLSNISVRTIEALEITQKAKPPPTFIAAPIELSAVATYSQRCGVPAEPPELVASRRDGAVKLPVCHATPVDVGTNEADDESDDGQAFTFGNCSSPTRCNP